MKRGATLITLLASYVAIFALALVFHFRLRPSVLAAFEEYATPMPASTRVALLSPLLPVALGAATLIAIVAFAAPLKRSRQYGLLGLGVVIAASALVFVVWAAVAPIFNPG